jgi:hypothetical protein
VVVPKKKKTSHSISKGQEVSMSMPEISSTEMVPNKFNAQPSKIVNMNQIRGLHFYQRQLDENRLSILGGAADKTDTRQGHSHTPVRPSQHSNVLLQTTNLNQNSASGSKIGSNFSFLRNRSTSPSIAKQP